MNKELLIYICTSLFAAVVGSVVGQSIGIAIILSGTAFIALHWIIGARSDAAAEAHIKSIEDKLAKLDSGYAKATLQLNKRLGELEVALENLKPESKGMRGPF